nr:twin-arginine translocation signal domain-containing protein [Proteiniphilum sp. UBA5384]
MSYSRRKFLKTAAMGGCRPYHCTQYYFGQSKKIHFSQ